ncbi:MAG: hypothetical protein ACKODX_16375 [Gemmata sp.]
MKTVLLAMAACGASAAGALLFTNTGKPDRVAAATPAPATFPPAPAARLVAHEWGTFTSFSGSDGVPVGFTPNNSDLPRFV